MFFKKFILSLIICLGGGWLTGLFTEYGLRVWYSTLVKAPWTPPNVAFPIVWTILYTMMAFSLTLVLMNDRKNKALALAFFGVQLFFNFIWSFLFFYLENPGLALLDLTFLWLAIIGTIVSFWSHSRTAALLLIPYFIWVSYAFTLNWFIWTHN